MSMILKNYTTPELKEASTFVKIHLPVFGFTGINTTWNVRKETPKMLYLEFVDSFRIRHAEQIRKSDIGVNKWGTVWVLPDDVKEVVERYHTLMIEKYTDKLNNIESYLKFHQSHLEGEKVNEMA